jgi:hypothetical protein
MEVMVMFTEYMLGISKVLLVESAPCSMMLVPSVNSKKVVAISPPLDDEFVNSKNAGVQSSNLFGVMFGTIGVGK